MRTCYSDVSTSTASFQSCFQGESCPPGWGQGERSQCINRRTNVRFTFSSGPMSFLRRWTRLPLNENRRRGGCNERATPFPAASRQTTDRPFSPIFNVNAVDGGHSGARRPISGRRNVVPRSRGAPKHANGNRSRFLLFIKNVEIFNFSEITAADIPTVRNDSAFVGREQNIERETRNAPALYFYRYFFNRPCARNMAHRLACLHRSSFH